MKRKVIFIIIAIITTGWLLWSGVITAGFEKSNAGGSRVFVKFDKNAERVAPLVHGVRNISNAAGDFAVAVFNAVGGQELRRKCKDDPVVFGGLFIFFGVSACGVGLIVHMIRTDSRFS